MFDKGGGPSGNSTDEGSGPTGQTLVRQAEEVRHAVTDAPHQAGRTAQDLQGSHHPAWDRVLNKYAASLQPVLLIQLYSNSTVIHAMLASAIRVHFHSDKPLRIMVL